MFIAEQRGSDGEYFGRRLWYAFLPLCIAALTASVPKASARVWTVERDGTGDFTVIQDAVDAASSGDVIQIGPGRFDEWHTFQFPASTADAHVLSRHDELTIAGSGADVTIIGPPTGPGTEQMPIGIMTDVNTRLYVRDLSIENVNDGVEANGPYVSVLRSVFRACDQGVESLAWEGTGIEDCLFVDSQDVGVMVFGVLGATNVLIEDSSFEGGLGGMDLQSQNSNVFNCMFIDLHLGIQLSFGATATIEGCKFQDIRATGIWMTGGANGTLIENTIQVCPENLGVANDSHCTGFGNTLAGGSYWTISMSGFPTSLELHDSHILNGGGWTLYVGGAPEANVVDLRNNWWGTTDAAQIDAWTRDHEDGADNVTVLFEPFHEMPIPTERTSFSGLKSIFGGPRD